MYKLIVFLAALFTVFSLNSQTPKDLPSLIDITVWEVRQHEPVQAVLGGKPGLFTPSPDSIRSLYFDSTGLVVKLDAEEMYLGPVGEFDYYWSKTARCWVVYFESIDYNSNGALHFYGYIVLKGKKAFAAVTVPAADLFLRMGDESLSGNVPLRYKMTSRQTYERISRMNTITERGTIRTRMGAR